MATKKTIPIKQAPATGTALVKWEEQFAADAAKSAKMEESTATGGFFSIRAGVLSWNDAPVENNQMAVIVVDSLLENVAYETEFDDDNPSPPRCFAFGRDAETMVPHKTVVEHGQEVNDKCTGCEYNKYGTADKGRGKKCRNIRRLAMIPAGKLDANGKFTQDKDGFDSSTMGFMKIPVTSTTAFAAYVKQLKASLNRPPYGVFTKVKVVPDAKTQIKVTFEPIGLVPNNLMDQVYPRVKEAQESIEQPYNLDFEAEERPKGKGKPAARGAKPAAKKAAPAKRKF